MLIVILALEVMKLYMVVYVNYILEIDQLEIFSYSPEAQLLPRNGLLMYRPVKNVPIGYLRSNLLCGVVIGCFAAYS